MMMMGELAVKRAGGILVEYSKTILSHSLWQGAASSAASLCGFF